VKFNYGKAFLLGPGFFGFKITWSVHNAYMPVFL